jgi:hypothetical protein
MDRQLQALGLDLGIAIRICHRNRDSMNGLMDSITKAEAITICPNCAKLPIAKYT